MSSKYFHERFGDCELVRIEGVDWIIRALATGQLYRVLPSRRGGFLPLSEVEDPEPAATESDSASSLEAARDAARDAGIKQGKGLLWAIQSAHRARSAARQQEHSPRIGPDQDQGEVSSSQVPGSHGAAMETLPGLPTGAGEVTIRETRETGDRQSLAVPQDRRLLRRAFESLRNGLNPVHIELRPFAVGIESVQKLATNLLNDVDEHGGRTVVLRGAYGQGKTFSLNLLREMALEAGFAVMSTEIDARENQLDKPHRVYHSLMRSLTFPDVQRSSATGLVSQTHHELSRRLRDSTRQQYYHFDARRLLSEELECLPLAWLLSDPEIADKPELMGLLSAEPGIPVARARQCHVIPSHPGVWPSFNAGTQGDFATYILSGIGRLTRFLGYRGLIVIFDEMEKWQDLDWKAQSRAGNLLGGLIWASSAEEGSRCCRQDRRDSRWLGNCAHARLLEHSRRCGGYPFTTTHRCSLGVAIAMTPRGEEGPESTWSEYGLLEVADLPFFSSKHLRNYMQKIFPAYLAAYGLTGELSSDMLTQAVITWQRRGDQSTRSAVQAIMSVLDGWRDLLSPAAAE